MNRREFFKLAPAFPVMVVAPVVTESTHSRLKDYYQGQILTVDQVRAELDLDLDLDLDPRLGTKI